MYVVMVDGAFVRNAGGNIAWSHNHFQTAESLSAKERALFNLYLVVDAQPELLPTQKWGEHTYKINGNSVTRTWHPVDKTADELAAEYAASIPQEVTMRQARLALLGAGMLASVEAAINGMVEPNRTAALIEWEYSNAVLRKGPMVQMLAPTLGLSAAQIDGLFAVAATL